VNEASRRCQQANARRYTRKLCRRAACPRGRARNPSTEFVTENCTRDAFAWSKQSTPTKSLKSNTPRSPRRKQTPIQHKPPSRLSTLRRTIWSGPHHFKLHDARSPMHAGLTKSYAHAPPTISTSSEAPMRRGVERRSRTSSRPSAPRRSPRTRRAVNGVRPPARAGACACRGPGTRSPRAGEHVGRALTSLRRGHPQKRMRETASPRCSARRSGAGPDGTYPHFWGQLCGRPVDNPFRSYGGPLYRLFSIVCSVEKSRMRTHI
jgi:hypothetical protein